MTMTGVNEGGSRLTLNKGEDVRDASGVVLRDGSRSDNNQAVARVCVPSSAGDHACEANGWPRIALNVQVRQSLGFLDGKPHAILIVI